MRAMMIACGLLLVAKAGPAAVLHVPTDYPTIGAATSVAASGDEVLVAPGTYNERFTLGPGQDGVKIHSESGPAVTIIDGGYTGSVVSMTLVGSGTELTGFTITHGGHNPATPSDLGGAIRIDRSSPKIDNDVISNCMSFEGSIYVNKGSPSITNCTLDGNSSVDGGGIDVVAGSPTIGGNTLTNNHAENNGGGIAIEAGTATITGNTIAGNHAQTGGGISSSVSSNIENNVLRDNSASVGGGIYVETDASTIRANTITNNQAGLGAGLHARASSPNVENNVFRGNDAGAGEGGGAYFVGLTGGSFRNNQLISNLADLGGGLLVYGNGLPIQDNLFQQNSAVHEGGGIAAYSDNSSLVENNRFLNNSGGGGGIYLNHCGSAIRGNLVQDNDSPHGSGGGIYVDQSSSATIENNVILRNHCVAWGGGVTIWAHSTPTLTGNTIALNRGDLGGGNVYVRRQSAVSLVNNILSHSPGQGLVQDDVEGLNSVTLSCNDISNNADGNYSGLADQTGFNGNFSLDPLFCDLIGLDVHLSSVSPCASANSAAGCDLVGALDVNCEGPVRAEATTWGKLKAQYR